MADLLGTSGDESDDQGPIKINEDYAQSYKRFREKEVYQRLKSKYGEEIAEKKLREAESDSDSSTEDESADELTEQVEKDFFKTLACLKSKDPRIYDGKTKFFSATEPSSSKPKEKKEKPMYLRDLERKVMLEKGGQYDEIDQFEEPPVTYHQELEEIKSSLKSKLDSDSDDDGEGGSLLQKKQKSKVEADKEEEDYRTWLAGQKDNLSDEQSKADLKPLRDFWTNDKLDENEKFLRDYILNQKFRKRDDDESESEESVGSDNLSEDEKTIQQQEEFEVKYNFRFEEPDQDFIKRYPRTIKDSMRQEPNSRKTKRLEVKDRKEREKEKKREEIKQLKAFKRKEIMEKLDKLKKIAGSQDLGLNEEDLEEDFDPEKYDKRMKELFQSYDENVPEGDDMEKPEFSDLESDLEEELEVENWDDWDGNESENGDGEDQPEAANNKESRNKLSTEMVELSRKRKRKSKFAEMIERKKPLFNPNDKTFEEYINEYYSLDFEDLVGDLPCRFRYRKVEDNDFGLSAHEVLTAPDSELNAWCSLRKTCQFRSAQEEKKEKMVFKSKANNVDLKKKILPSLYSEDPEEKLSKEQEKKSSRSKKRRKRKNLNLDTSVATDEPPKDTNTSTSLNKRKRNFNDATQAEKKIKLDSPIDSKKKKRRRKKKADVLSTANFNISAVLGMSKPAPGADSSKKSSKKQKPMERVKSKKKDKVNAEYSMSNERLKAYGLNPRKLKKKLIANSMSK